MKISSLLFLLGLLIPALAAWSHEEIELFELQQQLVDETKDASINFYRYFSLEKGPDSTFDEINQAYKTLSRKNHPDKLKRKKGMSAQKLKKLKRKAEEKFQRISVIGEILRGERKERYDYFLKNGFPKWKGTGYFYSKYRPSFMVTIVVTFLIISIIHYVAIKLNTRQQRKRIESLIQSLRRQAWGPSLLPPTDFQDRKVYHQQSNKIFLVRFDGTVQLLDKELVEGEDYDIDDQGRMTLYERRVANRRQRRENGASNSGPDVYLDVTADDIADVTFKDSLVYRLPAWMWSSSIGKIIGAKKSEKTEHEGEEEQDTIASQETEKEVETETAKQAATTTSGANIRTLPNGKKIYGRKKK